jgi:Rrf2 family iron-sulfur cluster assembly transcriptional regulator
MTHDLWATLNSRMYEYLSSVSLADLVARQRRKEAGMAGATVIADPRRLVQQPRPRNGRDKAAAII